jgi:hypothetical protein
MPKTAQLTTPPRQKEPNESFFSFSLLFFKVNIKYIYPTNIRKTFYLQKKSSLKSFFYHLPPITASYQKKIFIFAFWKDKFDNKNKKEDIYGKERQ